MRSSSRHPVDGPLAYAPSTHCFVNFCCSAGFLTRDEARDPGFTTIGIYSPFIPYDAGIETVRIWRLDGTVSGPSLNNSRPVASRWREPSPTPMRVRTMKAPVWEQL